MGETRLLYSQKQLPVFQNRMYDTKEEATFCPKGDMTLVEDMSTGLIYNADFCPDLVTYDTHYQNEQAVSSFFQQHLEEVASIIERTVGRKKIIEVGCGKGFFLEELLKRNFDIVGFDPAYEGNNSHIIREYYNAGSGIRADGILLRHVLEHIQNPVDFLYNIKKINDGGKVYIEVPCFDWICKKNAWFDIYYEHVNYFRMADFHKIFKKVYDSGWLFGGQYLYVVAELASLRIPEFDASDRVCFPDDFGLIRSRYLMEPAAVWGGASKGVIFLIMRSRREKPIQTVIDINPAKQGKFLPVTAVLVKSPKLALPELPEGSTIYVMNSNYIDEIKKMSGNSFNYIGVDNE